MYLPVYLLRQFSCWMATPLKHRRSQCFAVMSFQREHSVRCCLVLAGASRSRIRVSSSSIRFSISRMVSLFESSVDPTAAVETGTVVFEESGTAGVCPVWGLLSPGLSGWTDSFLACPCAVLADRKHEAATNTKHERTTRRILPLMFT